LGLFGGQLRFFFGRVGDNPRRRVRTEDESDGGDGGPERADIVLWLPVIKGSATLREVETEWSLEDLFDYHDAIAQVSDFEKAAHEKAMADPR